MTRLLHALIFMAAATAALAIPATAAALSCALPGYADPTAVVNGERTGDRKGSPDFFDRYDFAVVGTVAEKRRDRLPGAEFPHYTVTLDVLAAFGTDQLDRSFTFTQSDQGAFAGYRFGPGETYFVPIVSDGSKAPSGQGGDLPNYSFVCDPIFPIEASEVPDLVGATPDDLQFISFVGGGPADPPGREVLWIIGGLALVTLGAVAGVVVSRRSR